MKRLNVYDGGFKQILKLFKQLDPSTRKVTSLQTSLPLGYAPSTPTPDAGGGGSTGATTVYQWIAIPGAYIAAPVSIGVSGDDVDLGNDIYQTVAFDSSNPSRITVTVNGNNINHGTSGGYPRWEVTDSDTITLQNLDIAAPKGQYVGTQIIVRKVI